MAELLDLKLRLTPVCKKKFEFYNFMPHLNRLWWVIASNSQAVLRQQQMENLFPSINATPLHHIHVLRATVAMMRKCAC